MVWIYEKFQYVLSMKILKFYKEYLYRKTLWWFISIRKLFHKVLYIFKFYLLDIFLYNRSQLYFFVYISLVARRMIVMIRSNFFIFALIYYAWLYWSLSIKEFILDNQIWSLFIFLAILMFSWLLVDFLSNRFNKFRRLLYDHRISLPILLATWIVLYPPMSDELNRSE